MHLPNLNTAHHQAVVYVVNLAVPQRRLSNLPLGSSAAFSALADLLLASAGLWRIATALYQFVRQPFWGCAWVRVCVRIFAPRQGAVALLPLLAHSPILRYFL